MRLTITVGGRSTDFNVTALANDVTLADLFTEAGISAIPAAVSIDGRLRPSDEPISISGLTDGSVIDLDGDAALTDHARRGRMPVAQLVKVAGDGTGDAAPLTAGFYDLGTRAADDQGLACGRLTEAAVRLRVRPDGGATVSPLGRRPAVVTGHPIGEEDHELGGRLLTVTDGDGIPSIFAVRPERRRGVQRVVSSRPGRVTVLRPPRHTPLPPSTVIPVPEPPDGVQGLQPLSLVAVLGAIPAAVAMAIVFGNPRMLVIAAFSPLLVIGRWLEGKRRIRKGRDRYEQELAGLVESFADTVAEASDRMADHLLGAQPHLGELVSRVERDDPGIWERRCHHPDFLHVTLGYGSIPHRVETDGKPYGPLIDVLANTRLHGVPLTVPLNHLAALGLAGHPDTSRSLARAVLLEAVVLHGPADVRCSVISDHPEGWAWTKWLPHAVDDQGTIRVATDGASAVRLIEDVTPAQPPERRSPFVGDRAPSPISLLILDGDAAIDAHTIRVAHAVLANPDLRVIVIGSYPDQLPSYCAAVAVADAVGHVAINDPAGVRSDLFGVAVMTGAATAENAARRLGRLDDPERASAAGGIPTYTSLEELLSSEDLTPTDVMTRWDRHRTHPGRGARLDAVVGVTRDGPFILDIVKDGPHAVVAGTTGSGKSELLRSWVAALAGSVGPDRVNFVLVDFKGGGAFDACNDFPHTVGVVTDLDDHLAARALRCLKAELHHREIRLRAAAASSIEEYWENTPDEPLPRLMLIVDEFATLAQELPEFVQSLIDVAQRGRSLGIHMILATQRPGGVLDAKIKANTNLRIALRVQDDADSTDVIGTTAAARIDRRTPGRAMARLGASEIVAFQSALVTVATDRTLRHAIEVAPFDIGEQTRSRSTAATDENESTDLERLVEATTEAHRRSGLPPSRVPWPDPLPHAISIGDLPPVDANGSAGAGWATAIGRADLPDRQCQDHYRFDATDGHLLVYGVDTGINTSTLATIAVRMCGLLPPDRLHVYVIDFGSGGLAPLAHLPHVATWVAGTDEERLLRVIDRLERELAERRTVLAARGATSIGPDDDLPLVLTLIDNYGSLIASCEESGRIDLPPRFASVIRDGADLGVVVVASSATERGLPNRVAAMVTKKLVFRLADPGSYTSFGLRPREVPKLGPGRGIDTVDGTEVQVAAPSAGGLVTDVAAVAGHRGAEPAAAGPAPVETLPQHVALADVVSASTAEVDRWHLAFAQSYTTLDPTGFVLRRSQHAVIAGPAGSGRTTALRSVAEAAVASDPTCIVLAVGFATGAGPGLDQVEIVTDPARLEADRRQGRTLVLVDDADRLDTEIIDGLTTLAASKRPEVHIVAASTPDDLGSFHSWTKPLRASRIGLLLQPHREDGELLRTRLPLRPTFEHPPGRGFLVNGGTAVLAQVAVGGQPLQAGRRPQVASTEEATTTPRPRAEFGSTSGSTRPASPASGSPGVGAPSRDEREPFAPFGAYQRHRSSDDQQVTT